MKIIETPLDPLEVKKLEVNDTFSVTGRIFTARDAVHKKLLYMYEKGEEPPIPLQNLPMFHCGPIVAKKGNEWRVISAGPTTSIRLESFEDRFMDSFGTKIFIGKGGMGERTLKSLREYGGIYAHFTGGAGALMASSVERVEDVFFLDELGIPEALWVIEVNEFGPLLVTMDSKGSSIYEDLSKEIRKNVERTKSGL
ncbi:fumarate hydratase [candidate division MSBL1 archaeon SCGC-AAA261D19]|uniref:Fumarate hydratase n=1 Tax=candidate division MSBL1 archaeon SCGC-AAA261D19 TaxID=1698273 RepID=A0A133V5Z5_9EURY|nr:fumarate hydratase [candidate division MSBL1 archaeon SCGC-AAA261D19]